MKVLDYTIAITSIMIQSIQKYKFSKLMFGISIICFLGIFDHSESITESGDIYIGNSISLGFWWSVLITSFVAIFLKEVIENDKK